MKDKLDTLDREIKSGIEKVEENLKDIKELEDILKSLNDKEGDE